MGQAGPAHSIRIRAVFGLSFRPHVGEGPRGQRRPVPVVGPGTGERRVAGFAEVVQGTGVVIAHQVDRTHPYVICDDVIVERSEKHFLNILFTADAQH